MNTENDNAQDAVRREDIRQVTRELTQHTRDSKTLRASGHYALPQPDVAQEILSLLRRILFHTYLCTHNPVSYTHLRAHET